MTDFTKFNLTVASTRGSTLHSVGFNITANLWQQVVKGDLEKLDTLDTLRFREEDEPRGNGPVESDMIWVWVVMNSNTPVSIMLYLADLFVSSPKDVEHIQTAYP